MALGSTQPLTEMSTVEKFLEVKSASLCRCHEIWNLNFLELSGPVTGLFLKIKMTPTCSRHVFKDQGNENI